MAALDGGGGVSGADGAPLGVGIVGCGNIAESYLTLAPLFAGIEIRACADLVPAAAEARADVFGVAAQSVEALLANDDVDIVLNLTVPSAHAEVSRRALEAGRHVYSEKPFVLSLDEGHALARLAASRGLRVGSAPDTFLGAAHQRARALVDAGEIGRVTGGTAHVMSRGMEHWHPNPDFFYRAGAGPMLDVGPYYVTNLVQLLGPVRRVAAMAMTPAPERVIASAPRAGERVPVETPTTLHATLDFECGALVTLGTSWDVRQHGHAPMELYGSEGTLYVPDPNFFGGTVRTGEIELRPTVPVDWPADDPHPFGVPNQEHPQGPVANYRCAGLADLAAGIREGRPHRCSLELALHVVDVMTTVLASAERGAFLDVETRCGRPAPLGPGAARALLA